ncbi:AraC family transcriptional regulator [Halosquirtibacter laminarini]|uniref:AraC family transcriptional regulator n=1 Tax=Halosquirtibacter laminarini TaxID=3374600 RepID=A0AC61NHL0_9BACT|nr:AraC family transcriptional regulator [Prolixibacteraceae bacterium]
MMRYKIVCNVDELIESDKVKLLHVNREKQYYHYNGEVDYGNISFSIKNTPQCSVMQCDCMFKEEVTMLEEVDSSIFAIHFMIEGDPVYHHANGDTLVKSNSQNIWTMNDKKNNRTTFKPNHFCSSFCAILNEPLLNRIIDQTTGSFRMLYQKYLYGEEAMLWDRHNSITPQMRMLISQIRNGFFMGNSETEYIEEKVTNLVNEQIYHSLECEAKGGCKLDRFDVIKLQEAKEMVMSRYDAPLSLAELSKEIGLNQKKLKEGFKELFGNTVFGFLFEYRMSEAKRLLQESSLSISDIGYQCGYSFPSHFTTAFRRKFDCTPKTFRNLSWSSSH